MTTTKTEGRPAASGRWFGTTHWSVVLSTQTQDTTRSLKALETLCRAYWPPLYACVRRMGYSVHDAEDLTQSFFARLLEKHTLAVVCPEKGRFRSFLLVTLKRFLADEWDKVKAQKRGGGQVLTMDFSTAENQFQAEPGQDMTPEKEYERRWALALLEQVYQRLAQEYQRLGKTALFQTLRPTLLGDRGAIPYATLASQLGMTEGAVKVSVHRLRQRYRELLRAAVADTVAGREDVEDELRHLLKALSA